MRFLGITGLVLFLFGLIGWLALGQVSSLLMNAHLLFGIIFLLLWFVFVGISELRTKPKKRFLESITQILFGIGVLLFLVVLNIAVVRKPWQIDLTEEKVHSLSPQMKVILSQLKEPLTLIAIRDKRGKKEQEMAALFKLIRSAYPTQITTDFVNSVRDPIRVQQLGFEQGDVLQISYGKGNTATTVRLKKVNEELLASAINKLTRKDEKKLYLITGHGEPALDSDGPFQLKRLVTALHSQNIVVQKLLLSTAPEIPADSAALAIIRPEKDFLPAEISLLKKYIDKGGRVLFALDPRRGVALRTLLHSFGIVVGEDVVIDQIQKQHEAPKLGTQPLVRTYVKHAITKSFHQDRLTRFNLASTVSWQGQQGESARGTPLLLTSEHAWAETNLKLLLDTIPPLSSRDPEDTKGPLSLGVVYEKGDSKLIVFGDSDWLLNSAIDLFYNQELALNAFDWLVGFDYTVSIPARSIRSSLAPISQSTFLYILTSSFLLPELLLLLGLSIWWRRRSL